MKLETGLCLTNWKTSVLTRHSLKTVGLVSKERQVTIITFQYHVMPHYILFTNHKHANWHKQNDVFQDVEDLMEWWNTVECKLNVFLRVEGWTTYTVWSNDQHFLWTTLFTWWVLFCFDPQVPIKSSMHLYSIKQCSFNFAPVHKAQSIKRHPDLVLIPQTFGMNNAQSLFCWYGLRCVCLVEMPTTFGSVIVVVKANYHS